MMYAQPDSSETVKPTLVMLAQPHALLVTLSKCVQHAMTIINYSMTNVSNALRTVSTVMVTSVLNVITSGSSTMMVPAHKTVEMETMLMLNLVLVLNVMKLVPSAMEQTSANVPHV